MPHRILFLLCVMSLTCLGQMALAQSTATPSRNIMSEAGKSWIFDVVGKSDQIDKAAVRFFLNDSLQLEGRLCFYKAKARVDLPGDFDEIIVLNATLATNGSANIPHTYTLTRKTNDGQTKPFGWIRFRQSGKGDRTNDIVQFRFKSDSLPTTTPPPPPPGTNTTPVPDPSPNDPNAVTAFSPCDAPPIDDMGEEEILPPDPVDPNAPGPTLP